MLVCDRPALVTWSPDFSTSWQADPLWTKLLCGDLEVCNSLEAAEWDAAPGVQVVACEACGITQCAAGGWVHVSRLGRHVLWTPLELELEDDLRAREYTPPAYLREHGALAVPVIDWDGWRERIPTMPQAAELPTTRRRELLRAWKPPGFDPFERENSAVSAIADWLAVDAPVDADLVRADEIGAQVELLYGDVHDTFDRPHLREWQAFALRGDCLAPAFEGGWTLEPLPIRRPDGA